MADSNKNPDNQERQISVAINGKILTIPESTLNSIIEKRITKKLNNDLKKNDPLTSEMKLKLVELKSKAKAYEIQVNVFQHILGKLKRDLVVDKCAQPARYAPHSVYQQLRIKQIEKNRIHPVATFTISDDETPMTTIGSNTNQINSDSTKNDIKSSVEIPCVSISDDENEEAIINSGSVVLGLNNQNGECSFKPILGKLDPESKTSLNKTAHIFQNLQEEIPCVSISDDENEEAIINSGSVVLGLNNQNGECSFKPILGKLDPESKTSLNKTAHIFQNLQEEIPCVTISDDENEKTMDHSGVILIGLDNENGENSNKSMPNPVSTTALDKTTNTEYPPPFPLIPDFNNQPSWKNVPPAPMLSVEKIDNNISLLVDIKLSSSIANVEAFELYICKETEKLPDISMWKLLNIMKMRILPMQCLMDNFEAGYTYYFCVRAVDVHQRRGPGQVVDLTL